MKCISFRNAFLLNFSFRNVLAKSIQNSIAGVVINIVLPLLLLSLTVGTFYGFNINSKKNLYRVLICLKQPCFQKLLRSSLLDPSFSFLNIRTSADVLFISALILKSFLNFPSLYLQCVYVIVTYKPTQLSTHFITLCPHSETINV